MGPLSQFTQDLAAAATAQEAARSLVAGACALAGADTCRVALLTPDGTSFSTLQESGFAPGAPGAPLSPNDAQPLCEAIRQRQPLFREGRAGGDGAEAALPLLGSTLVGGISLGFSQPRRFPPKERLFLTLAAQIAALALERAQIAALALERAQIAALALERAQIAALALERAQIAALALERAQIAALALERAQIAALALERAQIAALALERAQIAALALERAQIAALALERAQIAALALERAQIAALALERAQAVERFADRHGEPQEAEAALYQIVAVQEEERRRFSRELHDGTGQYLTVLSLKLRGMRNALAPEAEAQGPLRQMEALVEGMGREIHHLAVRLRPAALDDLGLSEALLNYLDEWAELTGMTVDFHSRGLDEARLPRPVVTIIYRVVQEALNNIVKHAGAAHMSLILEQDDHSVCAIIEDDGRGFDTDSLPLQAPQGRRLGLVGMKERAAAIGGDCTVESSPDGGTTVFLRLPLAQHGPGHAQKDRP